MKNRIQRTMDYVHNLFFGSDIVTELTNEELLYRWEHTLRVAAIGQTIAKAEGLNEEALVIACLLHDVSYCKFDKQLDWNEHGHISEIISRPFVESLGFDRDIANDILYGISSHVTDVGNFEWQSNTFTASVGDCDNIDRFDVFRIYDTLHSVNFRDKTLDEQKTFVNKVRARQNKLYNMELTTPTATRLWREEITFWIEFFTRLDKQLNSHLDI